MYWVNQNNCSLTPDSTLLPDFDPTDQTRVARDIYREGIENTEVALYTIINGGHTWPDGYQYLPKVLVGRTSRDINANMVIWEFFATHAKK